MSSCFVHNYILVSMVETNLLSKFMENILRCKDLNSAFSSHYLEKSTAPPSFLERRNSLPQFIVFDTQPTEFRSFSFPQEGFSTSIYLSLHTTYRSLFFATNDQISYPNSCITSHNLQNSAVSLSH